MRKKTTQTKAQHDRAGAQTQLDFYPATTEVPHWEHDTNTETLLLIEEESSGEKLLELFYFYLSIGEIRPASNLAEKFLGGPLSPEEIELLRYNALTLGLPDRVLEINKLTGSFKLKQGQSKLLVRGCILEQGWYMDSPYAKELRQKVLSLRRPPYLFVGILLLIDISALCIPPILMLKPLFRARLTKEEKKLVLQTCFSKGRKEEARRFYKKHFLIPRRVKVLKMKIATSLQTILPLPKFSKAA